jgi:hypothetical protein
MSLDVCVVGEINPDLILYGLPAQLKPEEESLINGFRLTLGSSSAIFAHNLAVLGTGVGMVSKIGPDALGKMAFEWLANAGVDLSRVRVASAGPATGLTVILAQPSHRFILTYPGTMFEFRHGICISRRISCTAPCGHASLNCFAMPSPKVFPLRSTPTTTRKASGATICWTCFRSLTYFSRTSAKQKKSRALMICNKRSIDSRSSANLSW